MLVTCILCCYIASGCLISRKFRAVSYYGCHTSQVFILARLRQDSFRWRLACVAGGIGERAIASSGGAAIFPRGFAREGIRKRRTPLAFTALLPKPKQSRAKSRQLRRLAGVLMFRASGFLSLELEVKVYTSSLFVLALEIYWTLTRTSVLQLYYELSI